MPRLVVLALRVEAAAEAARGVEGAPAGGMIALFVLAPLWRQRSVRRAERSAPRSPTSESTSSS